MLRIIEWQELQLHDCIGEGGYGVVFQATYKNKQVAVKRLPIDRQSDVAAVKRFRSEMGLLSSLQHPSLVQSIGICCDVDGRPNSYACVTELLRSTLQQHLSALSPATATDDRLRLLLSVATGLQYLHERVPAITHSDLKPENVMVDSTGHAKLLDFGIARVQELTGVTMTQATKQGTAGTPQYMAPELFEDEPLYGTCNDVYAFGCLLLFVYTQQHPYPRAINTMQVIRAIDKGPPQLSPAAQQAVSEQLQQVFAECVQRDHTTRPGINQVVAQLSAMLHNTQKNSTLASTNKAAEEQKTATEQCSICTDDEPVTDGWTCASHHFTCKECAVALLQQSINDNTLRNTGNIKCGGGARVKCQDVFTRKHVTALTAATGYTKLVDAYMEAYEQYVAGLLADQQRSDQALQRLQREQQARNLNQQQHQAAADQLQERVRTQRLALIQLIDEQRHCPRCKVVFRDYDGCDALTCSNPRCRAQFCALCLQDCGTDAHPHVAAEHGQVYGGQESFNRVWHEKRQMLVEYFLSQITDSTLCRAVIQATAADLADLGINMQHLVQRTIHVNAAHVRAARAQLLEDDEGREHKQIADGEHSDEDELNMRIAIVESTVQALPPADNMFVQPAQNSESISLPWLGETTAGYTCIQCRSRKTHRRFTCKQCLNRNVCRSCYDAGRLRAKKNKALINDWIGCLFAGHKYTLTTECPYNLKRQLGIPVTVVKLDGPHDAANGALRDRSCGCCAERTSHDRYQCAQCQCLDLCHSCFDCYVRSDVVFRPKHGVVWTHRRGHQWNLITYDPPIPEAVDQQQTSVDDWLVRAKKANKTQNYKTAAACFGEAADLCTHDRQQRDSCLRLQNAAMRRSDEPHRWERTD